MLNPNTSAVALEGGFGEVLRVGLGPSCQGPCDGTNAFRDKETEAQRSHKHLAKLGFECEQSGSRVQDLNYHDIPIGLSIA